MIPHGRFCDDVDTLKIPRSLLPYLRLKPRQAPSKVTRNRRQAPRDQHYQRERNRSYPYPRSSHNQSAQNTVETPPRPSAAWSSPNATTDREPAPPSPQSSELSRRSSSPPPRKLGDTTFKYGDTDFDRREIRILRILPDSSDAPISCEILHTSLNGPLNYTAISYAWGDVEDTQLIILEGHEFPVTASLWQALQRLRSASSAVIVWADAICINQQNTEERNSQVQSMTKVYSLAHEVAIWLGPESDDSHLAMELLSKFQACSTPSLDLNRAKNIVKSSEWTPHLVALAELFLRDYWNRLWVVQEVINATVIHVYCGPVSLPWATYLNSSEILKSAMDELTMVLLPNHTTTTGRFSCSAVLRECGPPSLHTGESNGHNLLQALLGYRSKFCSDPRDKVYAILGIISAPERSKILVDYNISVREVYIRAAQYIITTSRRLDLICAALHYPVKQSTCAANLPSWVPDWSCSTFAFSIGVEFPGAFSAAKTTIARFHFSSRRTKLEITGTRIGEIIICGTHISEPVSRRSTLVAILEWRFILLRMVGEDMAAQEIFCQTLTFGQIDPSLTAIEWMERVYYTLARTLRGSLPALVLDAQLQAYLDINDPISDAQRYILLDGITERCVGRKFMMAESRLLCIGSGATFEGDIICIPLGCATPIILRKMKDTYKYIGDVYVHGYMHGKAIEEMESGERELEQFILS